MQKGLPSCELTKWLKINGLKTNDLSHYTLGPCTREWPKLGQSHFFLKRAQPLRDPANATNNTHRSKIFIL
jgi:hypothetical protein